MQYPHDGASVLPLTGIASKFLEESIARRETLLEQLGLYIAAYAGGRGRVSLPAGVSQDALYASVRLLADQLRSETVRVIDGIMLYRFAWHGRWKRQVEEQAAYLGLSPSDAAVGAVTVPLGGGPEAGASSARWAGAEDAFAPYIHKLLHDLDVIANAPSIVRRRGRVAGRGEEGGSHRVTL